MPNFSSPAGLEVAEKFVVVVRWWGGVEHVTPVSNSNTSCFRAVLSLVELRWVLTIDYDEIDYAEIEFDETDFDETNLMKYFR